MGDFGVAVLALGLPLSIVIVWLAGPTRALPTAAMLAVVSGIGIAATLARFHACHISVSRYGLVERGFFGATRMVPASDIAAIIRLDLYGHTSTETSAQLFALDADGRAVLRMRGAFWTTEDMDTLAPTLGIEQVVRGHPVTPADIRRENPEWLHWFERLTARPSSGASARLDSSSRNPSRR